MRVEEHPILGKIDKSKEVHIFYEGRELLAYEGETVASVLTSYGIRDFRYTRKKKEPRGVYCSIGRCTDCMMTINGKKNIRSCITAVEEGMQVERGGCND